MRTMKLRGQIVARMRRYLVDKGYLEVETPMLQSLQGGAAARPFRTEHNALDIPLFLRIAPELYLKRLLVGGFRKVFEINRNFRNEGVSPRHNPEFTMLEAYQAYGNYETMMEMVEEMVCTVAQDVLGTLQIVNHEGHDADTKAEEEPEDTEEETQLSREQGERGTGRTINLKRPWHRVRMDTLVKERTGWSFNKRHLCEAEDHVFARVVCMLAAHSEVTIWRRLPAGERRDQLEKELAERWQPAAESWITNKTMAGFDIDITAMEHVGDAIDLLSAKQMKPQQELIDVYEKLVEPTLIDPTFVTHVPQRHHPPRPPERGRPVLRRGLRAGHQRPGDFPRLHRTQRPRRAGTPLPPASRRRGGAAGTSTRTSSTP